jgi:hypothetical protein
LRAAKPLRVLVIGSLAAAASAAAASCSDSLQPSTAAPSTTEAELEIPLGTLVAVPQQNREDPAKGQFQVQIVNGTRERFDVTSVQFVWSGYTTEVVPRDSTVVGGQIIDFPVPFPGATCAGDGTIATMPSLDDALVLLGDPDGTLREVPVVDKWHLARSLYLDDCRRQRIDREVTIEWADLHEEQHDGRPVTAGVLRVTRGDASGEVRVEAVSGTIPYSFEAIDTEIGETVAVLPEGRDRVEVPIRFVEGRCDPHALAETKQPHEFVLQVDLGDGELLPHVVRPAAADVVPMRRTADAACVATGQVEFVGD